MQKYKSLSKYTRTSISSYGIVLILFLVVTLLQATGNLSSAFEGYLIPVCVYIVLAVSLNLVVGVSGELSLGHAGFAFVGAFSGICISAMISPIMPIVELRILVTLIVAGLVTALMGFLVGIPVLRLRGDYLAIVTLAFGEIIKTVFKIVYVLSDIDMEAWSEGVIETGGKLKFAFGSAPDNTSGLMSLFKGSQGSSEGAFPGIATFGAGILLVVFAIFVVVNLMHSKTGRAITALRDNRIAAESVGINATKYKMIAFVVAAALAGMAGALFSMNFKLDLDAWDYNKSIEILVFVVLGGMGNIPGTIIATTALYLVPELLRGFSDYRMLIYALVLILVMLAKNNQKVKMLKDSVLEKVFRKKNAEEVAENV